MRETLDGFQGGLQIGGTIIVTNLRYTDDIHSAFLFSDNVDSL